MRSLRFLLLLLLLVPSGNPLLARSAASMALEKAVQQAVPTKVWTVLNHIEDHGTAPDGYVGGRTFRNSARRGEMKLPDRDRRGRRIRYREWDVNRKVPGRNRGAERMVTGSDGSAYYTFDHYRTFIQMK